MLLRFNLDEVKPMSKETMEKGEAFINAMIQEGHTFESIKAGMLTCVVRCSLQLSKLDKAPQGKGQGERRRICIDRATEMLKTHRNTLHNIIRSLDLKGMVDEIRAAAGAR